MPFSAIATTCAGWSNTKRLADTWIKTDHDRAVDTLADYGNFAKAMGVYNEYVNARGGVHGRRITLEMRDDGYEPARTVQATRELVQEDGVFAIFASVGTANNIAVRPFLNQLRVPQLFVGSGHTMVIVSHSISFLEGLADDLLYVEGG